jgi:acylphosphatase
MKSDTPGAAIETWLVRVRGRVQGVGYRESCVHEATMLGVVGWIRNRNDGSVEALLHGHADRLAPLRDWLRRGPPGAVVADLVVTEAPPPTARLERFERRPTQ